MGSIHHTIILNIYAPNFETTKYKKEILMNLRAERDYNNTSKGLQPSTFSDKQ
jgi:hypothetical protein